MLRIRVVSKLWCSIIEDPTSLDSHCTRSYTQPGGIRIPSSLPHGACRWFDPFRQYVCFNTWSSPRYIDGVIFCLVCQDSSVSKGPWLDVDRKDE